MSFSYNTMTWGGKYAYGTSGTTMEDVVSGTGIVFRIEHHKNIPRPARKIDVENVPGRNGDILFPQDAWENYDQEYEIILGPASYRYLGTNKVVEAANLVAEWLYAPSGYTDLIDTFEPDIVRQAYYKGPFDVENTLSEFGRATITFNCRPERFLKTGYIQTAYCDYTTAFTAYRGDTSYTVDRAYQLAHNQEFVYTEGYRRVVLNNPTKFESRPYFYIYGNKRQTGGWITVANSNGTITISIDKINDYMRIDCDTMNVYREPNQNRNQLVTITPDGEFPVFTPGNNTVTWSPGDDGDARDITALGIRPRWWTI